MQTPSKTLVINEFQPINKSNKIRPWFSSKPIEKATGFYQSLFAEVYLKMAFFSTCIANQF